MARLYGPGPNEPPPLVWTSDLGGLSTSDVEGRPVGELFGALSEERTGLIRYVEVALRETPRHVLIPIGHARIDREATPPRVRLRAASHDDLLSVPEFDHDSTVVTAEYQDSVMQVHGQLFYGSRYYAHPSYDHGSLAVGDHPILGPEEPSGPEAREPGLRPLAELPDHHVARPSEDIRGWSVDDCDGERVGEVEDLLVELRAKKARYAVIRLLAPARTAAVPMGYLERGEGQDRLVTPSLDHDDLRLLPAFEPPLDRGQENRIHATLESRLTGDRYYRRPDFRSGNGPAAG